MTLVVRNGEVVTSAGVIDADIAIEGETIVRIGQNLPRGDTEINAEHCYVLPGGVDVHTHLDAPGPDGTTTADDFESGTRAAAVGGTTTIVDFCAQAKGQSLADALAGWHRKANGKAAIDYGFHILVVDLSEGVLRELADMPAQGVTSFKLFMAYKNTQMIDDAAMLSAMEAAKEAGAIVMVHAENGDAIEFLQKRLIAAGKTAPKYHAAARPRIVESEATARAVALAQISGASLYVVHLTNEDALEEVVKGRRRGVDVLAETCTHYLYTTEDDLDRSGFEGAKYVFSPAARTLRDQQVLWDALSDRTLQAVSSDHGSWNFGTQKVRGKDDFTLIPNGAPGIEERMVMVYQGVVQRRFELPRYVDLVSTMPARIFGLYPRKGTLAVGSDADIVIWDPQVRRRIAQSALHHAADYSLYEGTEVVGSPRTVLSRGKVIVKDGEFVGQKGAGQFLPRAPYSPMNRNSRDGGR